MVEFGFLLRGDELEEAVEALTLIRVELAGEVEQAADVGDAFGSTRLGEQEGFVMRLGEDAFEALGERAEAEQFAPSGEAGEEGGGFRE